MPTWADFLTGRNCARGSMARLSIAEATGEIRLILVNGACLSACEDTPPRISLTACGTAQIAFATSSSIVYHRHYRGHATLYTVSHKNPPRFSCNSNMRRWIATISQKVGHCLVCLQKIHTNLYRAKIVRTHLRRESVCLFSKVNTQHTTLKEKT